MHVQLPSSLEFLFHPARYKVAYGGRGGAKSWSFVRALLVRAWQQPTRILCARELQSSIKQSVHQLIADQIAALKAPGFTVHDKSITHSNGSEFIFEGLRYNVDRIKSLEGIDVCAVFEAKNVSKNSWDVLIPTIRKDGSEIWIEFNPELETDETYVRFVRNPPPSAKVAKVGWQENPWFTRVLEDERQLCKQRDPDGYLNIWEGNCRVTLEGAIYANELRAATADGRITRVPYDESQGVHTFWDLGWADCTSIWFAQRVGFEYRLIDFYQNRLQKLNHYLKVLQDKPYVYGTDFLPHDADNESLASQSIAKTMRELGRKVVVVPRVSDKKLDMKAAREIFPNCWFDSEKCADGIQALRHYRYEVDEYGQWSTNPCHDEHSHAADAFAQFARSISRRPERSDIGKVQVVQYNRDEYSGAWMQ